ncbi:MAG: S-layer homology domain-containing protein, partial [Oscillospiraceae bacterium]|nr:S-layer homology domain-containing protein [Oscillospiraceae bacterium]
MNVKRFLGRCMGGAFMALLLWILLPVQARAAAYSDVEGHWAAPAIERWSESGILKGYEDGRFGPDDPMTRAQLATVLYRLWGCEPREGLPYEDLDPGTWYYDALTTMERYEIALGRGEHIYPDERLTREEAFYMVGRALGFSDSLEEELREIEKISDWEEIDLPYFKCIRVMMSQGALNGSSDGKFHPKDPVTRAQVITVIDNIFDICINKPGEYTLQCSQVALVLCGDVQMTYTGKRLGYGYEATVYMMAGVGPGGVKIVRDPEPKDRHLGVEVKGVKEGEADPWVQDYSDQELAVNSHERLLDLEHEWSNLHLLFAGGIGTKTYPYQIKTGEQFLNLSKLRFSLYTPQGQRGYYAELCNDITLPKNQVQQGYVTNIALDGKGHTVTVALEGEFAIENRYFGVFQQLTGDISNLNLVGRMDVKLKDAKSVKKQFDYAGTAMIWVGALAGEMTGTLSNCTVSVDTNFHYEDKWAEIISLGSVAGTVKGQLANCAFAGDMEAVCASNELLEIHVGGLAGHTEGSLMSCAFTGNIGVDSIS